MNIEHGEKVLRLREKLIAFHDRIIYPNEARFARELEERGRFARACGRYASPTVRTKCIAVSSRRKSSLPMLRRTQRHLEENRP